MTHYSEKRWLLMLGGNRYNLPSIRRVQEVGFRTVVADRDSEAPGLALGDAGWAIDILDVDGLTTACQRYGNISGVVAMADVGVRSAAVVAERLGLPTIGREAAQRATSKAAMRRAWASLGAFSTRFKVVQTEEEAFQAVDELAEFPLIFKPDRSFGGSRGVLRVESREQVSEAFQFARDGGRPGTDVVIERFLVGSEHSCEVLIHGGRTSLLCIGQKIKSRFPFRVDISVQYPSPLDPEQERQVAEMCGKAVEALGITMGAAHIEFVYTAEGPVLMELGARCGGGHTPQIAHHVSGVDEFIEAGRMACGMAPECFEPQTRRGADYRFLVFPPGPMSAVQIPEEVRNHPAVFDVDMTLEPGNELAPLKSTAGRPGFAVVFGSSLAEVSACADEVCRQVVATYENGSTAHALTATDFQREPHHGRE